MKKLTLYKVEINACALFIYERITLWQSYKCNGRMVILNICHHFDLPCVNYQLTDEAGIWDCLECDTGAHVMGQSSHGIISHVHFSTLVYSASVLIETGQFCILGHSPIFELVTWSKFQ